MVTWKKKEDSIRYLIMILAVAAALLIACTAEEPYPSDRPSGDISKFPVPAIDYSPRHYVCLRTTDTITIDGNLEEKSWSEADWTETFVDIQDGSMPKPRYATRVKMLWDDNYFYVAAALEEPHLWGTLTERDAVIYQDNDFELFIDPDGDTHQYYELELNALGTVWDLLLISPYRDGGPAVSDWDIAGLRSAVSLNGTINNPRDVDSGWTVEIAIPWKALAECADRPSPPIDGDCWWVNFSRVEWQLDVANHGYAKRTDSTGKKPLPEDNWVWSPQGLIAMHYPEMWGLVQFSLEPAGTKIRFTPPADLQARWDMRLVYYGERQYEIDEGLYTDNPNHLGLPSINLPDYVWPPELNATNRTFNATLFSKDSSRIISIDNSGRLTESEIDR